MKAKLVNLLKAFLFHTGYFSLKLRLDKTPKLRILMYHGICDRSVSAPLLEQQLKFIKKNFDVYWASEVPSLMQRGLKSAKPPLVLTFDDGCINNAEYAAPLLDKHQVKSTFYIISHMLEGEQMLWNHEMRCRIALLRDDQLPDGVGPFPADNDERWDAIYWYVRHSKKWTIAEREALLEKLRAIEPDPRYADWMLDSYALMSESQLKSLPDIVEIGSHTMTHSLLDQMPIDACIEEIRESRKELEAIIGKPITTFCYPNGNFSDDVLNAVKETYDMAVTVEYGAALADDDAHKLKRIAVSEDPVYEFAYRLANA